MVISERDVEVVARTFFFYIIIIGMYGCNPGDRLDKVNTNIFMKTVFPSFTLKRQYKESKLFNIQFTVLSN